MAKNPIIEFRNIRINKVKEIRKLGISPYPSKSCRTHYAQEILGNFEGMEGEIVTVAGRLMSWRPQGALTFGHIQDQTGRIQLYLRKDNVLPMDASTANLGYENKKKLDVGDFMEARGTVTKTERGEISVLVETYRLLTKSIRPLPDKWAGLKDREAILRRRYLDTTLQPDKKKNFEAIAKMLYAIRDFLKERGFYEFHTPVLQPQYGGGTAKPFTTRLNALSCSMYLSISHELYLKRLITAGFDKVFTIGRYFRNEGVDRTHHPEFSMIETMTAYENYEYNMALVEDMFRYIAKTAFGKTVFKVNDNEIDFAKPWKRISMADAVLKVTGLDFPKCENADEANALLNSLEINEPQQTVGHALVKAFEERVEETLIEPTIIHGHPMDISPLAKPMADNPDYAERFEIFIGGMECGDNWSEQNDPVQLLERLKAGYKEEEIEKGECHPLDYDFIEVLEYGMPPTTGIGPGIERMAMMFTEQTNIDDVIFFPIMRPVVSPVNAAIYKIKESSTAEDDHQDVCLTFEEFETLVSNGIMLPQGSDITLHPCLSLWGKSKMSEIWRASGYVEVKGYFKNKAMKIAGYSVESGEKISGEDEVKKFNELIETSLVGNLKECSVKIEEVELFYGARRAGK